MFHSNFTNKGDTTQNYEDLPNMKRSRKSGQNLSAFYYDAQEAETKKNDYKIAL